MCGIAGLIHKNNKANIGNEMTAMLRALKHRGPDSTGYALYGQPKDDQLILRFKVAEQEDMHSGFDIHQKIKDRREEVDRRLLDLKAEIIKPKSDTDYAFRYQINFDGDLRYLSDIVEDVEGVEILSLGRALELIKDLGDADVVSDQYDLDEFKGTHAIGHTRMATESDVDIRSAHPYWAYPFNDISVVHNGQITNYWSMRRQMEKRGQRFVSNCDSELLAVYVGYNMEKGLSLEETLKKSVEEVDGVFTYLVATADSLGMAKDVMAAKPMVLYEGENTIALASEEVAIRSIFPQEIDTFDPYAGEVYVWHN